MTSGRQKSDPPLMFGLPDTSGWYPTLHTWDPHEGLFPSAHYFNGVRWESETTATISFWPIRFDAKDAAEQYAQEHDPDS